MKRNSSIVGLAIVVVIVLLKMNAFTALWMFLLVGAIPGTTTSLPAGVMLILFGVIIWLVFCQATAWHYVKHAITKRLTKQPHPVIVRAPRRRYGQI